MLGNAPISSAPYNEVYEGVSNAATIAMSDSSHVDSNPLWSGPATASLSSIASADVTDGITNGSILSAVEGVIAGVWAHFQSVAAFGLSFDLDGISITYAGVSTYSLDENLLWEMGTSLSGAWTTESGTTGSWQEETSINTNWTPEGMWK